MNSTNKKISVIIPVYNSMKSLEELHPRTVNVLKVICSSYEIIMVDDGSKDDSYLKMKEIRSKDSNVKIIKLIKNFGQHNALICGLNYAEGDYIITMDDDLQSPPEEIPKLLNEIIKGYDVVMGIPEKKEHNIFRNIGSIIITKLCNTILGYPKNIRQSSFRIFRKKVIDNIIKIKSSYPYFPAYIAQIVQFDKIANITIEHEKRKYGSSNYSIRLLLKMSFNLIINYSSLPLRVISIIGAVSSFSSIIYGIVLIIKKLVFQASFQQGWTSIIVLVAFLGGIILLSFGITGEYLKRIITEVSQKSQYIIEEKIVN